ncbi:hypothetical protein LOC71_15515 [Rhodopirellula sp. JC740]|uniref:Uncharacterized protein n=1 Tax=Rhodopirellula halodulae TaxID=2894198 RepID=A0ABS8NLK9_9BACT|nr:hypothetical protein [Rhodopirellula sp. JC740]MCC9643693.1 hypothetical protein [Rhodopirellula sp. JC740]
MTSTRSWLASQSASATSALRLVAIGMLLVFGLPGPIANAQSADSQDESTVASATDTTVNSPPRTSRRHPAESSVTGTSLRSLMRSATSPRSYQLSDHGDSVRLTSGIAEDLSGAKSRAQEGLASLRKPVASIRLMPVASEGELPSDSAKELLASEAPQVIDSQWNPIPTHDRYPVCFQHQPLHFEERNLERCGKGCGYFTNAVSAFWMIGNTAVWPYRLAAQPHCRCVRSIGDCRTCQSYDCPVEPLRHGTTTHPIAKGTLAEAAAIAGFTFLLL